MSIPLAMLPYKTTALTFSGCKKVAMRIEAVVVTHLCMFQGLNFAQEIPIPFACCFFAHTKHASHVRFIWVAFQKVDTHKKVF